MPHPLLTLALLFAASESPAPDFETQVLPVLTKAGCNAGACHGAALGQGGFALSLWGSNPAADHVAIVQELEGRRINLVRPERSLLLLKPTGLVDHEGGVPLEHDGPGARLVLDWLAAGAPRGGGRRLERFEVTPPSRQVERAAEVVTLSATAFFSDGERQDVTAWTVFTPADPAAVELFGNAQARLLRRGQQTVTARFLDRIEAVRLTWPLCDAAIDLADEPRFNFIDDEILAAQVSLRLRPAPLADDATFLRRVSLDLCGTLPLPEEIEEYLADDDFLADDGLDKRGRLVEKLLANEAFVDYWTLFFARLLRLDSRAMDAEGAAALHGWIRQQVAGNIGWDQMARELLTAEGDSHAVGPANFARATANARDQAEHVSQLFLGLRLRCANCHNHPLDRWTQDDYHGLAAIFARLERGRMVQLGERGEVTHPRTGLAALPRIPGEGFLSTTGDQRPELAGWITAADNPYFAQAMVNRLWKSLFGRGLVEPVDDLRATNPATHPELLNLLAEDFSAGGYKIRHTLRRIATSAAYAHSGQTTAISRADDRFYSHAVARPLSAEVLADALSSVIGIAEPYAGSASGARAIELVDRAAEVPALEVLGRCPRDLPCDGDAPAPGLARALALMNGPLVNERIASSDGRLARLLAAGQTDEQVLDELYLRTLGRPPSGPERDHWLPPLAEATSAAGRRDQWQDLLWALVNCREFVTNH